MSKIQLEQVSFRYNDDVDSNDVLSNINIELPDGEFTSIIGHSGCGKSTLLRLIAGLDLPREGSIVIDNQCVVGPRNNEAIVFQQYPLFPWMKVKKNVIFGIQHSQKKLKKPEAKKRAEEFLSRVGMLEHSDMYPYQLSGGMKQRVAIARALAMDSEILLLDEPFGALDPQRRYELQDLIVKLWSESIPKKNIIFVTHDIDESILLSDRIIFMKPGRIEKTIDNPLPRPRNKLQISDTQEYKDLRHEMLQLFYLGGGPHD